MHPEEGIYDAVHRAALSRFLPSVVRRAFDSILREIAIVPDNKKGGSVDMKFATVDEGGWWPKMGKKARIEQDERKTTEISGGIAAEAMIPSTLFFDNPQVYFILHFL